MDGLEGTGQETEVPEESLEDQWKRLIDRVSATGAIAGQDWAINLSFFSHEAKEKVMSALAEA